MGGVMQSGVSTAQQKAPLSVCPRLRTGTHSSDRKVRTQLCSVAPLSIPHPCPSFHPFNSSFSLVFIHYVFHSLGRSRSLCSGILLPPHPPTHLLMCSVFAPAQFPHYLVTSSFYHLLSSCLPQRQPYFLF